VRLAALHHHVEGHVIAEIVGLLDGDPEVVERCGVLFPELAYRRGGR
jgi:hypothetical protein